MREMHKWKDKVELSLDNRQIFFLFFGLSVVGCFVFALGVMTGRRLQWDPATQAKTLSPDSLALLGEDPVHDEPLLAFEDGLRESDAADKPPTRDPDVPPASKEELEARKAKAELDAVAQAKADAAKAKADAVEQAAAKAAEKETVLAAAAAPAKPAVEDKAKDKASAARTFTLQFKAFSRESDAQAFAEKLRRNGHDVRVESTVVRGRTWHRVRLGHFDKWEDGLAAKAEFEKGEHFIAYVVSQ